MLPLLPPVQIFYNASASLPPATALKGITPSSYFTATAIVPDLNFAAGQLKAALFPGGMPANTNAAVGLATTMLQPDSYASKGPFIFKVV